MSPTLLYFSPATTSLGLFRSHLPADWRLDTLAAGDDDAARTAKLRSADILIHANVRLTAADVEAAERLAFVQRTGAGLDGLDLAAVRSRGIPVATCDGGTDAVAEHTIMLMLAVGRHLMAIHDETARGGWPKWEYRERSVGLWRKTVGIVGFGRIGQAVTERVLAFGGDVLVRRDADRALDPRWPRERVGTVATAEELFARSDFVSLHCPATPENRGFVDAALIGRMRPEAILVNTARGALVDEPALAEALRAGRIAGAGLDVLTVEPPPPDHPLLGLPNVVVTPHVASGTRDSAVQKVEAIYANIQRFLRGEPLVNAVP